MDIFSTISENFQQYILDVINEKRHAKIDIAVSAILFVASRIYRNLTQLRHWLYDKRIIRDHAIGCLVVSIGNLTCGGTGKTPVVEVFARTLTQRGRKVAVLSRGYKSKDKRSIFTKLKQKFFSKEKEIPPRVVSDGKNLLLDADTAGDEPYMLASNLPEVIVIVDKDRVKAGLYSIQKFQTDTLILDDGFQYLDLRPHINIVLVDSTKPFHNHHTLPRGILRESIKNIRRADYIFLTKSDGSRRLRHLKKFLRKHNRWAEIIECCHKPKYLEDVFNPDKRFPLSYLNGKKIAALSGIASPESFEDFLKNFNAEIVYSKQYADHHRYSQQEIIDVINEAKLAGCEAIITTEKDAVRIPRLDRRDTPIYFMRVEIDIISGKESFDQSIARICFV